MYADEFFIHEWTKPVVLPNGTETTGIFTSRGSEVSVGIGIDAAQPNVALREADAEGLEEGDTLVIDGKQYLARTFDPPDEGITIVYLED